MACQALTFCPDDPFTLVSVSLSPCYIAAAPVIPAPTTEAICYAVDDAGNFVLDDLGQKVIVPCV